MTVKLSSLSVNIQNRKKFLSSVPKKFIKTTLVSFALIAGNGIYAQTGTWTLLNNTAPDYNQGVMVQLTDGTVIAHDASGGGQGKGWDKLTPDATGSYINGTWTQIASMAYDRLFFPTQVLINGKVFAAGGEYGQGATHGEVYDPVTNKWTATSAVTGNQNIYDGNSQILPSGAVLVGLQNGAHPSFDDLFYTPGTNAWTSAPQAPLNHDEAAWLKLPDSSILFVGIASTQSCRYRPQTNTWVTDGTVPVSLYDTYGKEAGSAIMLPNGKAVFFGATGHNAIYKPSGNASPGTWSTAADFPKIGGIQMGTVDAPAAMMPNGKILCAVSPIGTSAANEFKAPTYFFEYDYTTNTFTQVTSPLPGLGGDSLAGINCDFTTFLLLPTGQVLLGINQTSISKSYWIYTPTGAAIAAGKPVINSMYETTCGTYFLTGKVFNGISEGAAFGDDWAMSTNFPIIRLTDGTDTWYAKTTNWNRIGAVQTDSLEDTTEFTLPVGLPAGTYSLVVVANGIPSSPMIFTTYGVTDTVLSGVACNKANSGDAEAMVSGGQAPYSYKWSNGATTNSASGLSVGTYTVTVTDKAGCVTTASVDVTMDAPPNVTSGSIVNVKCNGSQTGSIQATASAGTGPYTYAWSPFGGTQASASNLSAGTYTVTVTDKNGCSSTATATITQPSALAVTQGVRYTSGTSDCDGFAWAVVGGGIVPYHYSWSPNGETTDTITALCNGQYCCTVTDKNGCTDSVCITVITGIASINAPSSLKIFPNPNNGKFNLQITNYELRMKSEVEIYNVLGEKVYSASINIQHSSFNINISNQPNGIYLVRVISGDGKQVLEAKLIKAN